ncbi:uncharacterized protein LOC144142714 [Haemaphysalis longicornis]
MAKFVFKHFFKPALPASPKLAMVRKRKLSDEEIAEQKRRRIEASRIRRANETPEARKARLIRQRERQNTEEARLRIQERGRRRYERQLQAQKHEWEAHRRRQHRLELLRLQKEANAVSRPQNGPVTEGLLMISQFEKPCSRFQERVKSPVSKQERVESAVVVEVLCGLCQRLCPQSDVQWANEDQRALLARIFPGEDVTLFTLCSKCRRSLSDNKVPLLARRCRIVGALVPAHSNPLIQESGNMDVSCTPGGLLVADSAVLVHPSTSSGDLNGMFGPGAQSSAEVFSCCLAKSCAHTAAAALPSDETPKLIEVPGVPGAWTQCSVWVSTRSTQAKPSLRTTAAQTEDEAIGTGQKK